MCQEARNVHLSLIQPCVEITMRLGNPDFDSWIQCRPKSSSKTLCSALTFQSSLIQDITKKAPRNNGGENISLIPASSFALAARGNATWAGFLDQISLFFALGIDHLYPKNSGKKAID